MIGAVLVFAAPPRPVVTVTLVFLAALYLSLFLLLLTHEVGHALAGALVGFRFFRLIVWPFALVSTDGRLSLIRARGVPPFFGFTQCIPKNANELAHKQLLFILGGPIASFAATGLLLALAIFTSWPAAWLAACVSLLITIGALLPIGGRVRSDGGRILDLTLHGPRRERLIAVLRLATLLGAGVRPGELPDDLLELAAAIRDGSMDDANVQFQRYFCKLDRGDVEAARESLDRALSLFDPTHTRRNVVAIERAFFVARFDHDSQAARNLLKASARVYAHPHTRLRAEAATLFAEGQIDLARQTTLASLGALDACREELQKTAERDWLEALLNEIEHKHGDDHTS